MGEGMRRLIIMAVLVLSTLVFALSPIHAETPKLSLHDCIYIALKNQPAIRAAQENVNAEDLQLRH